MGIDVIERISQKYGSDSDFVLVGGGNTSYKDEKYLYIKGSGTELATITANDFVKMSRKSLDNIWDKAYSVETNKRESEVLADIMASKCPGEESKRPSVETLLHNLFSQSYILHVHPAMINGITCSKNGEETIKKMFPDAIWVEETEPGYILASKCRNLISEYERKTEKKANLLFLQNHGAFFASNSEEEMNTLVSSVMKIIKRKAKKAPNFSKAKANIQKASVITDAIKCVLGEVFVNFTYNKEVARLCKSKEAFEILMHPMTPDHIVYGGAEPAFAEAINCQHCAKKVIDSFKEKNGYTPKVIFVKDYGMFTIGQNEKDALNVTNIWLDAIKISVYAQSFGGVHHMSSEMVDYIANWEAENYRSSIALGK